MSAAAPMQCPMHTPSTVTKHRIFKNNWSVYDRRSRGIWWSSALLPLNFFKTKKMIKME
jgi:hypothetical protein